MLISVSVTLDMLFTYKFLSFTSDMLPPRAGRFMFRIAPHNTSPPIEIAVDSEEEMKDWIEQISVSSSTAIMRVSLFKECLFGGSVSN